MIDNIKFLVNPYVPGGTAAETDMSPIADPGASDLFNKALTASSAAPVIDESASSGWLESFGHTLAESVNATDAPYFTGSSIAFYLSPEPTPADQVKQQELLAMAYTNSDSSVDLTNSLEQQLQAQFKQNKLV